MSDFPITPDGAHITATYNKSKLVCYDPRDASQVESDPSTWRASDNVALVLAHHTPAEVRPSGYWNWIKTLADYCDEVVPGPESA